MTGSFFFSKSEAPTTVLPIWKIVMVCQEAELVSLLLILLERSASFAQVQYLQQQMLVLSTLIPIMHVLYAVRH